VSKKEKNDGRRQETSYRPKGEQIKEGREETSKARVPCPLSKQETTTMRERSDKKHEERGIKKRSL